MPPSLSHDKVSIVSGTRCLTFHSPWAQPPITCVTHHHAPSPSADALPHHHVRFAITAALTHSAVCSQHSIGSSMCFSARKSRRCGSKELFLCP